MHKLFDRVLVRFSLIGMALLGIAAGIYLLRSSELLAATLVVATAGFGLVLIYRAAQFTL